MDNPPAFQRLCTLSLLSNLSNSGRTTNLQIANEFVTWSVYFKRGRIVFASHSIDPFERLQRHLNRLGHKKMPGLDEARARINVWELAQSQDYLLLDQWVSGNLLLSSEMAKVIEGLIIEFISSLLLVNEGYFRLDDSKVLPASFVIEHPSILSECQRRLSAWQLLGPQIISPYQRPCLSEPAKTHINLPLKLAKTLKGFSSFYQLGVNSQQDELELAKILHPHIEVGEIRLYNPIPPFNKLPNTFVKECRKFSRTTLKSSEKNVDESALASARATSRQILSTQAPAKKITGTTVNPIAPQPLERVMKNVGETLTVVPNDLTTEALLARSFIGENRKDQQYTIACVDDSPTMLATLRKYLDDETLSVELISNPVSALMKIIRLKPKLILLDVTMASIDGYELCGLVRNHSSFRDTPIIMVTGNTGIVDRVKARLVGASGYLAKPFKQTDLLKMVFKHLKP